MVFLGFEALHPLKWTKNFLVLKKNPYLVNLVPIKVGSSTCSKKSGNTVISQPSGDHLFI